MASDQPRRLTRRSLIVRAALTAGSLPALSMLVAACTDGAPATPVSAPAAATSAPDTGSPTAVPKGAPTTPPGKPSPTRPPESRPTPAPTPTRQSVPATVARNDAQRTVRIGVTRAPESPVGWPGRSRSTDLVQNLLFNWLVIVNDRMQPVPDLVEEVPTLENGGARFVGDGADRQLQVTFALRRNARWSNGDPVTSSDVKFTWDLVMNSASLASPDLELNYERIDTPDARTVVCSLFSERSARAAAARDRDRYGHLADQLGPVTDPLYVFGLTSSPVWPSRLLLPLVDGQPRTSPRVAELMTRSAFAARPVGSGPYTLRERTEAGVLTFDARAEYHRGTPLVPSIALIVAKREALLDAMKAGSLEVIPEEDVRDLASPGLVDQGPARLYVVPSTMWELLCLNLDNPILKDKAVRKALYHALDRKALAERSELRGARAIGNVISDWSWAYAADVPAYEYNPPRAEDLLEQANWKKDASGLRAAKDGQKLRLTYKSTDTASRQKVAALLRDLWRKIGVELVVEHVPNNTFYDRNAGPLVTRAFDVAQLGWQGRFDPGADAHYEFHSASIPVANNRYVGGNFAGYRNPDSDRLLASGLSTLTIRERVRIYQEWQKLVMDELPALPLYSSGNASIASARLRNYRPPIMASVGETWNAEEWDLS